MVWGFFSFVSNLFTNVALVGIGATALLVFTVPEDSKIPSLIPNKGVRNFVLFKVARVPIKDHIYLGALKNWIRVK